MLSEDNKNKIFKTGLYSHTPEARYRGTLYADNLYHCMNWTFKPNFYHDGNIYMVDTYFNNKSIQLTDDNFDEFSLIFDFKEVEKENYPEEYDPSDVYRVAIDSGGMYCGKHCFKKKGAKPSKEKLIDICKNNLRSAQYNVEQYTNELQELENGTHWKLK